MQLGEPGRLQSAINITPLVDVVLVLLIIFMVVAPHMRQGAGPDVDMPATATPPEQAADRARILVTIDEHGALWIEDQPVAAERFAARARNATGDERARLWQQMAKIWPAYDEYQAKTSRQIPVVVLERI